MALITVAAPVTTSPPAQTRSREVRPVSSSATMLPRLPTSRPGVVMGISGLGLLPMAQTDASIGMTELGARDLDRAAAARGVGLAQLHAQALDLGEPAALVADEAHGQGEEVEDDALLLGVLDLLGARRQLGLAAAVDDVHLVGAQAQGGAGRVHGHVAAARTRPPAPSA